MSACQRFFSVYILLFLSFLAVFGLQKQAHAGPSRWTSQVVYVPLYSHIYGDDRFRDRPFLLTATLSIRNTDPDSPLILVKSTYYDSDGNLLKEYTPETLTIKPLGSIRYIIKESDSKGGSGAKFLVRWQSEVPITEPIIESVMIGTKMQQGISFVSRGKVITGVTEGTANSH